MGVIPDLKLKEINRERLRDAQDHLKCLMSQYQECFRRLQEINLQCLSAQSLVNSISKEIEEQNFYI